MIRTHQFCFLSKRLPHFQDGPGFESYLEMPAACVVGIFFERDAFAYQFLNRKIVGGVH
jgi:hypothetical protein